MTDRPALVVAALALVLVTSGCLDATGGGGTATPTDDGTVTATPTDVTGPGTDTPTDAAGGEPVAGTESIVFDHWGEGAPAIAGGIEHGFDTATERYYVTTVTSAADAERFNYSILPPAASGFVRNTSFETASLVVIQAFPASSHPDYRVESVRRDGDSLRVAINDSSEAATDDITVETVLLRVPGDPPASVTVTTEEGVTFGTDAGVTTVTPDPTPTPEPTVSLPYTATDPAGNVDDPLDLVVRNEGEETNGYRVTVTSHENPECRTATPPCGTPDRRVEVFDRRGKLRPGADLTVTDLVARRGTYTVTVTAELPDGAGGREAVTRSVRWRVDDGTGALIVTVTDDGVSVANATAPG